MKQTLLTLCFVILAIALSAQTGLFGLSYGDSHSKVKSTLGASDLNFTETMNSEDSYTYTNDSNIYVDHINCFFDTDLDELVAWQVFYLEQDDDSIEDIVYNSAMDWHDFEPEWDDYLECDYWLFEDGRTLYAGWDYDYEFYVAEYYNDDYPQYSFFEVW